MNRNNTISGDGRNPRCQAEIHLLPQMLQTWIVELVILKKKKKPKSTKNWKKFWRGFIFSPLSPCASVFACLLLACAVSAMLCEVVASGVSSSVKSGGVDGEKVKGDMDFDVVLCQSELIERALQLCHLLPPGFLPVGLNSYHSSHTQPCVSLSGCLIEPNGHSSCSAARIFGRKRVHIFVCTSSVHSCVIATRVRPPTDFIAPKKTFFCLFLSTFCFNSSSFLSL